MCQEVFAGFEFVQDNQLHNVYGAQMTYAEYATLSVACKTDGRSGFTANLQGR